MHPGPRTPLTLKLTAAAALLLLGQLAMAQTEAPKADKGLERAQKAADAVFHWIKLNGDKGASRQPPAPAPAAPAPVARKPAPAPTPVATTPRPAPSPAAPPATALATAPAPAPAPAPVAATVAPEPEPERAPVLLAMAAPTPAPAAPMAAAARAVEPPPPPPPPAEEAEVPLKLLSRVNPSIPRQLQQQPSFREGFARVKFTVAPNGSVSKAETLAASHSRLGPAAVEAVKQWRFEPIAAPREVAIEFAFNNADD